MKKALKEYVTLLLGSHGEVQKGCFFEFFQKFSKNLL